MYKRQPYGPYGHCGLKATLNLNTDSHAEPRSCVKIEVDVLGSPSLIILTVLMVTVDIKPHWATSGTDRQTLSKILCCEQVHVGVLYMYPSLWQGYHPLKVKHSSLFVNFRWAKTYVVVLMRELESRQMRIICLFGGSLNHICLFPGMSTKLAQTYKTCLLYTSDAADES